jgi:hypothetical protein
MLIPYSFLKFVSVSIAAACVVGLLGFFAVDVAAKEVDWNSGGVVVSRPRRYRVRVHAERRSKRSVNVMFFVALASLLPVEANAMFNSVSSSPLFDFASPFLVSSVTTALLVGLNSREHIIFNRFVHASFFFFRVVTLPLSRLKKCIESCFHETADVVPAVGPISRHFKWWGNSCHYHTLLEVSTFVVWFCVVFKFDSLALQGVIFPLIESNGGDIFKHTPFGAALLATYHLSLSKCKREVSGSFRAWFNGTSTGDGGAVFCGDGHGDSGSGTGTMSALVAQINAVFGLICNNSDRVRFLRQEDITRVVRGELRCSNCASSRTVERRCGCVVPLRGESSVARCIRGALIARESCKNCHVKETDFHVYSNVQLVDIHAPPVMIIEATKEGNLADYGVSSSFELDLTLTLDSYIYDLVSVTYRVNSNHFMSDTLRTMPNGTRCFVRIDDMSPYQVADSTQGRPVNVPTGQVSPL